MNPIILEEIQPDLVDKLRNLAQKHNRSLEAEITAILEQAVNAKAPLSTEKEEWQPGFFEEVIGGWQGEPLVREPQPQYQEREPLL